ncbi:hypothetical protein JYG23_13945 [Sedimentibacter sp. zth1]|uniref:hypothetical protein n=1 Tax=Sedimentibacter sp. zth1 TaxID=2816908 RepID=UPI001A91FDBA|nr:hypothetical protein [Sedimentibacter sp. zth1]QSX05747.1 hypothetical protein JYG23_13945 [Sedimentibacter sp. zth1]
MFTQFFGNYLLSNEHLTSDQLSNVLVAQKNAKVKLGVLAINAGLMTSEQVRKVHHMQSKVDKKFGNIAVELGYLTDDQVVELLNEQKSGYLLLGQTIVDKGYMTLEQIEIALENYKKEHKIENINFSDAQNYKLLSVIEEFYKFKNRKDATIYAEYISLLFKNIIRFIGQDFIPLNQFQFENKKCDLLASQNINGKFSTYTAIEGNEEALIKFASRFSEEEYAENNEYVMASVGEFLNLNNGIFSVNMSNTNNIELELTPQDIQSNIELKNLKNAICIPVRFTFGIINFIMADIK